jgi:hypothetical protein
MHQALGYGFDIVYPISDESKGPIKYEYLSHKYIERRHSS